MSNTHCGHLMISTAAWRKCDLSVTCDVNFVHQACFGLVLHKVVRWLKSILSFCSYHICSEQMFHTTFTNQLLLTPHHWKYFVHINTAFPNVIVSGVQPMKIGFVYFREFKIEVIECLDLRENGKSKIASRLWSNFRVIVFSFLISDHRNYFFPTLACMRTLSGTQLF